MRSSPHIPHPSFTVEERITEILRQGISFLIEPLGPSKFRLTPIEGRGTFSVSIGYRQTCTCHDPELCSHILYVMIRYFRVPTGNPVLWQTALTDHEIDLLLNDKFKFKPPVRKQLVYTTRSGKKKVKRLPITSEDVCPVCYDSFNTSDKSTIVWCRLGCGGNIHRKCLSLG
jgi:E3 ubiquitin-protein ligase ZSWIM2